MPATSRASIIAGPALVTHRGQTLFSKDDLRVVTTTETFDVKTSGRPTQKREDNVRTELTFTPNGVWAPVVALMIPYASMLVGADLFGDTDSPVVVRSADGYTYTYSAGALTRLPDVVLSAGKTLFGPLTLTALGKNNTAPTDAAYRVAIASAAYPANDGYDPAGIVTQPYSVSWGNAAPWTGLDTEDGATISFHLATAPKKTDSAGVVGLRFTDLVVTARAKPVGVTSADVLAAFGIQGAGAGRGRRLGASGRTLAVSGTGVYAALSAASLNAGGDTFSGSHNRVDVLTWQANTALAGGAVQPLFFLGTAAPGS